MMGETEKPTKKREYHPSGEPGIYHYFTEDGKRWGAVVERERDWRTGKRRPLRKHGFRTKVEARNWRIAELDKRRRGDTVEPSMTPFGVYVDEWLAGLSTRPKSILTYRNRLAHMTSRIGNVPLSRVTTAMLDRAYRELEDVLSNNYVREIHGATKAVLQRAVDHRMIPYNPATLAKPPAKESIEHVTWTQDQMHAFLAVQDKPFWDLLFRFMAETWVRIGELIVLTWDMVDCDEATVRIESTVTLDRNSKRTSNQPKTEAGRRTIAITDEIAAWLRRHKDQQRFAGQRTDLVFPAPRTGKWLQQPPIDYALKRRCAAAGVPMVTPHGIRHIGGSLAYAAGVPLKVISERMGHSNATITHNVYVSIDPTQHRAAAVEIGRILNPGTTDATHRLAADKK